MERDLKKTAAHLGMTRPKLIELMRAKDLLDDKCLPKHPKRDRAYLRVKESNWWHPQLGMQYSKSVRVKQAGIPWLAEQIGVELPPVPADRRDVA